MTIDGLKGLDAGKQNPEKRGGSETTSWLFQPNCSSEKGAQGNKTKLRTPGISEKKRQNNVKTGGFVCKTNKKKSKGMEEATARGTESGKR